MTEQTIQSQEEKMLIKAHWKVNEQTIEWKIGQRLWPYLLHCDVYKSSLWWNKMGVAVRIWWFILFCSCFTKIVVSIHRYSELSYEMFIYVWDDHLLTIDKRWSLKDAIPLSVLHCIMYVDDNETSKKPKQNTLGRQPTTCDMEQYALVIPPN